MHTPQGQPFCDPFYVLCLTGGGFHSETTALGLNDLGEEDLGPHCHLVWPEFSAPCFPCHHPHPHPMLSLLL